MKNEETELMPEETGWPREDATETESAEAKSTEAQSLVVRSPEAGLPTAETQNEAGGEADRRINQRPRRGVGMVAR